MGETSRDFIVFAHTTHNIQHYIAQPGPIRPHRWWHTRETVFLQYLFCPLPTRITPSPPTARRSGFCTVCISIFTDALPLPSDVGRQIGVSTLIFLVGIYRTWYIIYNIRVYIICVYVLWTQHCWRRQVLHNCKLQPLRTNISNNIPLLEGRR